MCILCFSDYNTFRNTRYKVFKNDVIKNIIHSYRCNTVKKLDIYVLRHLDMRGRGSAKGYYICTEYTKRNVQNMI